MSAVIENQPKSYMEGRRIAADARQTAAKAELHEESVAATQIPHKGKPKRALIRLLEDKFPNYQPVLEMCAKAHRISAIADQRPSDAMAQMDAVNAHEKVAKYVTPQLKAVDLTSGGEQIQFGFQLNLAQITKA